MIVHEQLRRLSEETRQHLFNHILPFWCGPAVDHVNGGWMAWLSNDLQPDRTRPKGLIVHSRLLWTFSAVHQANQDSLYLRMADRARDFLVSRFWDPQYGGAFWQLNDRGQVADYSKKIYGQAFCIYALTEFAHAFNHSSSLERAVQLFDLLEQHAHDPALKGYVEVCQRDWSEAPPGARLSDKDMDEKKSMNNHLHLLEAFARLHRARPSAGVADRLRELIELFLERIVAPSLHLHHFFDEQWGVRSDHYTFGHDIEAGWLLCEAAEELGDQRLLRDVRSLALQIADATLREAVGEDGGIYYEGQAGRVTDRGRESWPQAEALVGFLNAFQISGQEKFAKAALNVWDFIQNHICDRRHGEWFWRIHPDGRPDSSLPKVSEWKGPYHGSRACLETMRRVGQILAGPLLQQRSSSIITNTC